MHISCNITCFKERNNRMHLLYILGPFRGVTEGHESTVGQDGEHDQHAEHRGDKSQGAQRSIRVKAFIFCML